MADPYQILGVSKTASAAEIKKAFRNLAKKHHPDAHPGDETAKKTFQEISGAYDILGDKDKRAKYDAGEIDSGGNPSYGAAGAGAGGGFGAGARGFRSHPFGGGAGNADREFHFTWDNQGGEGFAAEDIFADILGGGRRGGRGRVTRGEDFSAAVTVSFAEGVMGGTRRVALPNGEQIDVRIPVGVKDGQQIRVKGRGGAGRNGGPSGDVLIQVAVAAHPFLSRDGNDLRMDLPVSLKEAVLGGKVPVPTLTGTVNLSIPANSGSGTVLRLKGKGVPTHGEAFKGQVAGDLYVRLMIALPDKPDATLARFVEGWEGAGDPRARMRPT